jgi:hypothetical protein
MKSSESLSSRPGAWIFSRLERKRTWRSTTSVSHARFDKSTSASTYVDVQDLGHEKARKDQAVANFLHENTSRPKGRRSHIRTAVVIDNDTNDDVDNGGGPLADQDGSGVEARVLHLGCDREVSWQAAVCQD